MERDFDILCAIQAREVLMKKYGDDFNFRNSSDIRMEFVELFHRYQTGKLQIPQEQ